MSSVFILPFYHNFFCVSNMHVQKKKRGKEKSPRENRFSAMIIICLDTGSVVFLSSVFLNGLEKKRDIACVLSASLSRSWGVVVNK